MSFSRHESSPALVPAHQTDESINRNISRRYLLKQAALFSSAIGLPSVFTACESGTGPIR